MNQYKINRMFVKNQERGYQQMDGIRNVSNEKSNAEENKQFWSNIWVMRKNMKEIEND